MRQTEFYVSYKIINDAFYLHGATPNMPITQILDYVIKHNPGDGEVGKSSEYKVLIARQITDPGNLTIKDLDLREGDYLLFYHPPLSSIRLKLIPPAGLSEFHKGWVIQNTTALIGRADEEMPDVDLTPLLDDPLKISRKLALLKADGDKWTIELHKDAHSGLFVGENRLERNTVIELNNETVLRFGRNINDPDLILKVKLEPIN